MKHFSSAEASLEEGCRLRVVFQLHSQELGGVGDRERVFHSWRGIWVVDITVLTAKKMVKIKNMMKLQSLIDNDTDRY